LKHPQCGDSGPKKYHWQLKFMEILKVADDMDALSARHPYCRLTSIGRGFNGPPSGALNAPPATAGPGPTRMILPPATASACAGCPRSQQNRETGQSPASWGPPMPPLRLARMLPWPTWLEFQGGTAAASMDPGPEVTPTTRTDPTLRSCHCAARRPVGSRRRLPDREVAWLADSTVTCKLWKARS
jgi:hypothetical protein